MNGPLHERGTLCKEIENLGKEYKQQGTMDATVGHHLSPSFIVLGTTLKMETTRRTMNWMELEAQDEEERWKP